MSAAPQKRGRSAHERKRPAHCTGQRVGICGGQEITNRPAAPLWRVAAVFGACALLCVSPLPAGGGSGPIAMTVPAELHGVEGFPLAVRLTFHSSADEEVTIGVSDDRISILVEQVQVGRRSSVRIPQYERRFGGPPTTLEVVVPARGCAEHDLDLRKWAQVLPAGRYRVTSLAKVGDNKVQQHVLPLTVTADHEKLRSELGRIEARMLDPHGDFHFLWRQLDRFDPKYTVDSFVRILESIRTSDPEELYAMWCLDRIRVALELGWASDPPAIVARLATLARRTDTQEWIKSAIRWTMGSIALEPTRPSPDLVAALQKHFGATPRVIELPIGQDFVIDGPLPGQPGKASSGWRALLPFGALGFCMAAVTGYVGVWVISRVRRSRREARAMSPQAR